MNHPCHLTLHKNLKILQLTPSQTKTIGMTSTLPISKRNPANSSHQNSCSAKGQINKKNELGKGSQDWWLLDDLEETFQVQHLLLGKCPINQKEDFRKVYLKVLQYNRNTDHRLFEQLSQLLLDKLSDTCANGKIIINPTIGNETNYNQKDMNSTELQLKELLDKLSDTCANGEISINPTIGHETNYNQKDMNSTELQLLKEEVITAHQQLSKIGANIKHLNAENMVAIDFELHIIDSKDTEGIFVDSVDKMLMNSTCLNDMEQKEVTYYYDEANILEMMRAYQNLKYRYSLLNEIVFSNWSAGDFKKKLYSVYYGLGNCVYQVPHKDVRVNRNCICNRTHELVNQTTCVLEKTLEAFHTMLDNNSIEDRYRIEGVINSFFKMNWTILKYINGVNNEEKTNELKYLTDNLNAERNKLRTSKLWYSSLHHRYAKYSSLVRIPLEQLERALKELQDIPSITWTPTFDVLLPTIRTLRQKAENFNEYMKRLHSFLLGQNDRNKNWNSENFVWPGPLVEAGFSYEGEDAIVVCKYCNCRSDTSQWTDNDTSYALNQHKAEKQKDCHFLGVFGGTQSTFKERQNRQG